MPGILNIVVWSHEIGEIHTEKKSTSESPVSWRDSNRRYKQHCPWDMLKQQYAKCSVFKQGYWHILIVARSEYLFTFSFAHQLLQFFCCLLVRWKKVVV